LVFWSEPLRELKSEDTRLKRRIRVIKERYAYEERLLIRERWASEEYGENGVDKRKERHP
jgi:hypothetical protein